MKICQISLTFIFERFHFDCDHYNDCDHNDCDHHTDCVHYDYDLSDSQGTVVHPLLDESLSLHLNLKRSQEGKKQ